MPRIVVVDVSGMAWLVGVDFGFLIALSKRLSASNTRLALVGNEHVRNAARVLKLSQFFDACSSVDEALRMRGPNVMRPGTESRSDK